MEKILECPNCSSSNIAEKYIVQDRHYGVKGDFNLSQCKQCKLVFLNPMFNDDELAKFYPEDDYYSYYVDFGTKKKTSPIKELVKKIIYPIKEEDRFATPGKVLDIGCGNGWVLYNFLKKGWQVAGVEPSKIAAEIGNKSNLNIHNGTLLSANYPTNEFDYVRSNHAFEHIYNPNEVLAEMHRVLKHDGKMMMGIPNYNGINSKIAKEYWYYLGVPVHTFNYSPKNITQMLAKHNFEVTSIKYVSSARGILGSIQVYLNRKNGKKSNEGSVFNSRTLFFIAKYIAKLENLFNAGDCIEVFAVKKFK
jgi:SAM-dependent methyltransferase